MRVLVACEFSGIVRDAFLRRGHDAMSCDLLTTEKPGPHYCGDVRNILGDGWDLMIAHPPCTFLSYAATAYWTRPGRARKRLEAASFFMDLTEANVPRIAIENPLGIMSAIYRKPDQMIEPYYFGDSARKRTCLWLVNLPPLRWAESDTLFDTASAVPPPEPIYTDKTETRKHRHFTDANHGGKLRSVTFPGIAEAMAEQWGGIS